MSLGKLEATAMPLTFVVWLMRAFCSRKSISKPAQTLGQAGGYWGKGEAWSGDSSLFRAPILRLLFSRTKGSKGRMRPYARAFLLKQDYGHGHTRMVASVSLRAS